MAATGLRIEARADGFHPEAIAVPAGTPVTIEFVRTAEKTCADAVVFPSSGERHELSLNIPVIVTLTVPAGQSVLFACPMDMYRGEVRAGSPGAAVPAESPDEANAAHDPSEIAHWTCSMHPSVKSQTPGTCPICSMDLVPVTRGEIETGVILVDAQRRQLIGVMTGTVERRAFVSEVRTVGIVRADEARVRDVTLRTRVWIDSVQADFTGKSVRKGEPLLRYFSPDLLQMQREYLLAAGRSAGGPDLRAGADTRLRLAGMELAQIEDLAKRGSALEQLTLTSPITGTVIEKHVVAGSEVEEGEPLYRIADLSSVWIEAEVYEQDIARMQVGQGARIALQSMVGRDFEGIVSYVYPSVDAMTRTGRVRFETANPEGALKLNMYADIRVDLPLGERLAVPESAVIHAGASYVAFVDLGEGRLEPRRLKVGVRTAGYIEVLDGLKEGETVVTSANFLIAAESKLKSGIEKW